ncbi:glycosyltransferase family 4 protein [Burkholderia ubonensis]|uniref:glycosyltransferase family 4 protein n=1 Tax=Burkholderia ubonensis TaxID=101571 RepID=UPI0007C78810|nr:glycosyltransferase family 4 protein [Burkholderia ubonensis]
MHQTDWLGDFSHPSPDVDFALPNGIYFLLKFLPELKHRDDKSLQDRLAVYFWWEAIGARCYPDFTWTLRSRDRACLDSLDDDTLCTSFAQAIGFWLRHKDPSALERPDLMRRLLRPACDDHSQVPIPYFLHVLREDREDLARDFDLRAMDGRLAYLRWWETHGAAEYIRIDWSMRALVQELSVLEISDGAPLPQPRMLNLIRNTRRGLRENYPVHTLAGQLAFLGWWERHGATEYPTLDWTPRAVFDHLLETEIAPGMAQVPMPRILNLVWQERQHLHSHFDRNTIKGQLEYIHWWREDGQSDYPEVQWSPDELVAHWMETVPVGQELTAEAPRFIEVVWSDRDTLREAFDLHTAYGVAQMCHWWNNAGRNEYSLLRSVTVAQHPSENGLVRYVATSQPKSRNYPFGVNIVGFPQGILGLAEDARMMGQALELAHIPRAFINAPMAGPAKVDTSVMRLLTAAPKYHVSVFCLPPPEMMRLALEGGRKLLDGPTYKIGAWPWELPHWPTAFSRVGQFVDEIWAQSRFVQSTFAKLADTPVHHMPMAVDMPAPTERSRERFGLPAEDFLFYLMFDGNSWLTRKNPLAGVQAFQKAFDASVSGVGLVVKAMNIRESDPIWQQIVRMASRDRRIHIVSETLSRHDSVNFMASLDSYISLHRSEGFGRVIAEAMLLGQPVVVTNFSGNVDYCTPDTAFLVDGDLVPLRAGDYLFHEGQFWCDPDIDQAAQQIRRVLEDSETRTKIAGAGQQKLRDDYSIAAVARRYAAHLANLEAKLENQ